MSNVESPILNTIRIELWAKYKCYKSITLTNNKLHDIKAWIRQNGRNADYALIWLFGAYGWYKRTVFNVVSRWDFRPLNEAFEGATKWPVQKVV